MNQVIFIFTTPKRQDFLENCLNSLHGYDTYPIIIMSDYTYPHGKCRQIQKMGGIDELLLLSDSMEILDTTIFDMCFKDHVNKNVSLCKYPCPFYFFPKFTFETFSKIEFCEVKTKREEVLIEGEYLAQLNKLEPNPVILFTDCAFDHSAPNPENGKVGYYEEKFGRKNVVLGNNYFKKYQGTWDLPMAPDELTKR